MTTFSHEGRVRMSTTSTRHRKPFVQPRLTRYGMIEKITMSSGEPLSAGKGYIIDKTGFGEW